MKPAALLIIFSIVLTYPSMGFLESDWKLQKNENGVRLFVRDVKGHTESEYKGVCIVNQSVEDVGSILSDIPSYPKWFFKCIESKKIPTEDSSDQHFYFYVAVDTPWPFSDRDAVYKSEIAVHSALGKVVIQSIAIEEPLVPLKEEYVRITDSEHRWILEKLSAERTRVTFINRTNAAGPFANYISNPGIHDTTLYSLQNLTKMDK